MFQKISISSQKFHEMKCKDLKKYNRLNDRIFDRQLGVPGFDQESIAKSEVMMIGAGGLGGEIGEGLVRKGAGKLTFFDADTVSISNLNRQQFYQSDVGKNKATQIVKNLQKAGFMGTALEGYPIFFQEYQESKDNLPDILVCGVDNDEARVYSSQFGIKYHIPVIFTAVSRDANQGYVFIQKPGEACFGCVFPEAISNKVSPCPNTPAIKDILKVVAGMVLFAIDSVLMDRKCTWNYRMIYLAGFMDDQKMLKQRNLYCKLCSKK